MSRVWDYKIELWVFIKDRKISCKGSNISGTRLASIWFTQHVHKDILEYKIIHSKVKKTSHGHMKYTCFQILIFPWIYRQCLLSQEYYLGLLKKITNIVFLDIHAHLAFSSDLTCTHFISNNSIHKIWW